jgi:hypothetical protein
MLQVAWRRIGRSRSLVLCAAIVGVAACASYGSAAPPAAEMDASPSFDVMQPEVTIIDPARDAGSDAALDSAARPDAPPPQAILYVSGALGNDASDGLTTKTPLKSIGGAMAAIVARSLTGYEVRICQGQYEERDLRVAVSVALRGGYNCGTWTRSPMFGKAGNFLDPNATRIVRASGSTVAATLSVAHTGKTVLDGLDVRAASDPAMSSVGIDVQGGTLEVRDTLVVGAQGMPAIAATTVGLSVKGAELLLVDSEFRGGAGKGTGDTFGSNAAVFDTVSGKVLGCRFLAGTGSGHFGGVGVRLFGTAAALQFEKSSFEGEGNTCVGVGASVGTVFSGVYANVGGPLVFLDNTVSGGKAHGCTGPTNIAGLNLGASAITLERNRVDPGEVASDGDVYAYGIHLIGEAKLVNNVVSSGSGNTPKTAVSGAIVTYSPTVFLQNTVFAAPNRAVAPSFASGVIVTGSGVLSGSNNLILAPAGYALRIHACAGASVATLSNNAYAGVYAGLIYSGDCASSTYARYESLGDPVFNMSANNLDQVDTGAAIVPGLASDWPAAIVTGRLGPSKAPAGCALARGGADLRGMVPVDIMQTARNSKPSIGAFEVDTNTCPER